ncbi:MAG: hypothetical protein C7B44_04760 [Sulfobacillus thermosulfidooxidans]|nr:MAG: hypothetical protein C7B44_04760 [Sulfobacillus thermosulfidooxidans]
METKNFLESVANNLERLRHARQWSSAELAKRAGVAKATVSQLERRLANPTLETLWALANAFGVPFSALIEDEPVKGIRAVVEEGTITTLLAVYGPPLTEVYHMDMRSGIARDAAPHPRGVRETVVVLSGRAEVGSEDFRFLLERGQSTSFAADVPHFYRPLYEDCALVVFVFYPASPLGLQWEKARHRCHNAPDVYEGDIEGDLLDAIRADNRSNERCQTFVVSTHEDGLLHYYVLPLGRWVDNQKESMLEEETQEILGPGLRVNTVQDPDLNTVRDVPWILVRDFEPTEAAFHVLAEALAPKGRLIVRVTVLNPYQGRRGYVRESVLYAASRRLSQWDKEKVVDNDLMRQALEAFVQAWRWNDVLTSRTFMKQWVTTPKRLDGPRLIEMASHAGFQLIRHRLVEGMISHTEWGAGSYVVVFARRGGA